MDSIVDIIKPGKHSAIKELFPAFSVSGKPPCYNMGVNSTKKSTIDRQNWCKRWQIMGTIKRECRVCDQLSDIEIGEWDWTTELTWICPACEWEEFVMETDASSDLTNCSEACDLYGYCIC